MVDASALNWDLIDTRIQELVAFARDRDGEDRTLLFRNLIDLFLTGKAPRKEPTRGQLLDVIEAMIPHVEPESRRTVADLVSQISDPPLDLILRLIKDLPHLVGDLLLSPALDEDDIIDLIGQTGREHHHIIASRTDLSANVWIALARAAPSARKAQAPSSLALWSDSLGGADKLEAVTSSNVTELYQPQPHQNEHGAVHKAHKTAAPATSDKEQSNRTNIDAQENRQAANLRILRTDKDLISERLKNEQNILPETSYFEHTPRSPATEVADPDQTQPPFVVPAAASVSPPHVLLKEASLAPNDAGKEQAERPQPTPLQNTRPESDIVLPAEPEKGWCWRSDRDGNIIAISRYGKRLLNKSGWQLPIGGNMLDLLCLHERAGHPVARAFQRRSTVHDAPLSLDQLEQDERSWTLEAIPLFSNHSGAFEGYEGLMSPVAASKDELFPDMFTDDQDVFIAPFSQPKKHTSPSTPFSAPDTLTDETIDRTKTPPPASGPIQEQASPTAPAPGGITQQAATLSEKTSSLPKEDPEPAPMQGTSSAPLPEMSTSAVLKAIAEALGEAAHVSTGQGPEGKPEKLTIAPQDLTVTLDLLEQSLGRILEGTKEGQGSRLQAEIAAACLRTLRDQLKS